MLNQIYETLARLGYHHPIHPPLTHLPVGLVTGAFLFILASWIFNRKGLARSARHCITLALLALVPAALFGFMDWRHFYAGALLSPIRIKMGLAVALAVLLLAAWAFSRKEERIKGRLIVVFGLCLATVSALGFFGGELVYGVRAGTADPGEPPQIGQGADLFVQKCALCHFADKSETKIGPGLKGLFQQDLLAVSQKPVSEDAIINQLISPVGSMPPFPDLSQEQIQALIAYLKTL